VMIDDGTIITTPSFSLEKGNGDLFFC